MTTITWRMRLENWLWSMRHPIDSFQYAMMTRYCDRHDLALSNVRAWEPRS